ncbi:MAG: tRNA (guanosine(37)-N1)-methyltransferase TrmD [Candidatus Aminicenantaceae bacterium]
MRFDIITIFPDIFGSFFSRGVINKALEKGLLEIRIHDLRDFTNDKHRQVDDRPFGGGPGMVLKVEPVFNAVKEIKQKETSPVYLLSPQGKKFDFSFAGKMAQREQIVLICGRYEGVDERVRKNIITDEISIGDYILTGGEIAAIVLIDAVSRFVSQVVGKSESVQCDSFYNGLLDFPHYTRPRDFKGMKVPDVLFSGNHEQIKYWRQKKSLEKTMNMRPDLLEKKEITPEEKKILKEIKKEKKG